MTHPHRTPEIPVEHTPVNGEVLDLLRKKIDAALQNNSLSKTDRTLLEIQQLFVVYLSFDHAKVMTMWAVFRPFAWGAGIFAAALITMAASGRISIIVK